MNFRLSSFKFSPVCVAIAISAGWMPAAAAAEKPRGSSIEFSDSASSISTNLNQLGRKADSLKQLEQDLFKPFKVFSPKSSLDGVSLPPPRAVPSSVIQNKRVKELIERRKNWIFMSPEDFASGTTASEIFNLPEYDEAGQEKEKESKLDRFYRNMDRESGDEGENPDDEIFPLHKKKKKPHEEFTSMDEEEEEEKNGPLKALRESEKSLKTMFDQGKGGNMLAPLTTPNPLPDLFGFGNPNAAAFNEPSAAQKARMEEFKQLLGSSSPPASGLDSLNSFGFGNPRGAVTPPSSFQGLTGSGLSAPTGVQMPTTVGSGMIGVPDMGRASLPSILSSPVSAPRAEPPKPVQFQPAFNLPQRKF